MNQRAEIDRLMLGVIPYVVIDDARAAITFYRDAFGAVEHGEAALDPDGRVMNATLEINGGMMMLMDPMGGSGCQASPAADGKGLTLQLVVADGDVWWTRAVEAGCTVTHPFQREFWGDRYGRVRDPFGLEWAVNEPGSAAQT